MTKIKGLAILGYFIWWSLRGTVVKRDEMEALLRKHDLDKEIKFPKLVKRSAFLMAVREVKRASGSKKLLIRNILKSGDYHLWGLVDESVDKQANARHLEYNHAATLKFDQKTGNISVDHPHRAFDEIKAKYEFYTENMNSYDIRVMVQKAISQWKQVSVRDGGCIYFLPSEYEKQMEKMYNLFLDLPGDCYLEMVPQVDTERSKKAIYRALMEDLSAKMEKFKEQINDGKFTSVKGWTTKLKEFRQLKEEIEFYSEKLSFSGEALQEKLESFSEEVMNKIESLEVEQDKASKKK